MNVIKSQRLYFVEQCCAENGVPHNCLGLCVEDNDATRSLPFSSFCGTNRRKRSAPYI